jgi:hypothetical protein
MTTLPTVGHQRRAGDIRSIVGEQERHRSTDVLLQPADPTERDRVDEVVELLR